MDCLTGLGGSSILNGVVLRIGRRDGRLPAWRVAILRRTKQKRHTGTDTVDLFLNRLADESRRTKYMSQVSLVALTGNSSAA
jgi:hypothetical protein